MCDVYLPGKWAFARSRSLSRHPPVTRDDPHVSREGHEPFEWHGSSRSGTGPQPCRPKWVRWPERDRRARGGAGFGWCGWRCGVGVGVGGKCIVHSVAFSLACVFGVGVCVCVCACARARWGGGKQFRGESESVPAVFPEWEGKWRKNGEKGKEKGDGPRTRPCRTCYLYLYGAVRCVRTVLHAPRGLEAGPGVPDWGAWALAVRRPGTCIDRTYRTFEVYAFVVNGLSRCPDPEPAKMRLTYARKAFLASRSKIFASRKNRFPVPQDRFPSPFPPPFGRLTVFSLPARRRRFPLPCQRRQRPGRPFVPCPVPCPAPSTLHVAPSRLLCLVALAPRPVVVLSCPVASLPSPPLLRPHASSSSFRAPPPPRRPPHLHPQPLSNRQPLLKPRSQTRVEQHAVHPLHLTDLRTHILDPSHHSRLSSSPLHSPHPKRVPSPDDPPFDRYTPTRHYSGPAVSTLLSQCPVVVPPLSYTGQVEWH